MTEFYASLKGFLELIKLVQSLWKFYQANKTERWFKDSTRVCTDLAKPDRTIEQKKKSISDLADLLGGM